MITRSNSFYLYIMATRVSLLNISCHTCKLIIIGFVKNIGTNDGQRVEKWHTVKDC